MAFIFVGCNPQLISAQRLIKFSTPCDEKINTERSNPSGHGEWENSKGFRAALMTHDWEDIGKEKVRNSKVRQISIENRKGENES